MKSSTVPGTVERMVAVIRRRVPGWSGGRVGKGGGEVVAVDAPGSGDGGAKGGVAILAPSYEEYPTIVDTATLAATKTPTVVPDTRAVVFHMVLCMYALQKKLHGLCSENNVIRRIILTDVARAGALVHSTLIAVCVCRATFDVNAPSEPVRHVDGLPDGLRDIGVVQR